MPGFVRDTPSSLFVLPAESIRAGFRRDHLIINYIIIIIMSMITSRVATMGTSTTELRLIPAPFSR